MSDDKEKRKREKSDKGERQYKEDKTRKGYREMTGEVREGRRSRSWVRRRKPK